MRIRSFEIQEPGRELVYVCFINYAGDISHVPSRRLPVAAIKRPNAERQTGVSEANGKMNARRGFVTLNKLGTLAVLWALRLLTTGLVCGTHM